MNDPLGDAALGKTVGGSEDMSICGNPGFEATLAHVSTLLQRGRHEECVEKSRAAIKRFPGRPMLRYLQGHALLGCSRNAEAEKLFCELKAKHANLPFGDDGLVFIYYRQRKWNECVEAAESALTLSPGRPNILCLEGVSLLMLEQFERLKQLIEAYLSRNGTFQIPMLRESYFSRQSVVTPCLAELYGKACIACRDLEQGLDILLDIHHYKEESAVLKQLYGCYCDVVPPFDNSILC